MELLFVLLTPFLVNVVMQLWKKLPAFSSLNDGWKKTMLRGSAGALSFALVLLNNYMNGSELDPTVVENAVSTFIVFLASQGSYLLVKKG